MLEIERGRQARAIGYYQIRVDPGSYSELEGGSETIRRQLFDVMEPNRGSEQVNWRVNRLGEGNDDSEDHNDNRED